MKALVIFALAALLSWPTMAAEFVDTDLDLASSARFPIYESKSTDTKIATAKSGANVHLDLCLDEDGAWCMVTMGDVSGYVEGADVNLRDGRTLKDAYSAMWVELKNKQATKVYESVANTRKVDIIAFGDSLTAGAGGKGTTYPAVMAKELSLDVENRGIGGQISTAIAARAGAIPIMIKTDGGLKSFLESQVVERGVSPLTNQGSQTLDGFIGGLSATLSRHQDDSYGITVKSSAGLSSCTPCEFVPVDGPVAKKSGVIVWAGRNNYRDPLVVRNDIEAIIKFIGHDRYLVGGILNGEDEPRGTEGYGLIEALNASLKKQYGDHYVDVKDALMAEATGSEDAQWVEADVVPKRFRSDKLHLSADGYVIVGKAMARAWAALPK